ncbi:phage antirepressor protein [Candidatus Falkowbacteria bacterium CG10_big_fil_rev_8_21_14_0_10_37_18]|uniref:Phage antirepressor protein n=2 Tax=Parcubacteria group TaxID=1794811 RepID=A0A1J4UVT3_9BACT|nr:MAG: phage antirepressor protein [Candidatus Nomurabacteria bacterium CG1_02_31_12]PIR95367.1 MAG: phage antirepressor protein [Candidatus Falkowbacteria bacterium CG10_big_fil_rev_8_21_14_0_10_37_18]
MTKEIKKQQDITLFEQQEVRKKWHKEKWYFAINDVVQILTDSKNVTDYIKKLRIRDKELSKGWGQIVTPLSIDTKGGKQKMNCTDLEGMFRIIQSISSPKAEPFKRWLAKVGKERIDEIANPELAVNRAKEIYEKKGYEKSWIDKRMRGIAVRNTLTDEWKEREIKGIEYGILTNEIYEGTFEQDYKSLMKIKGLDKKKGDNLRDHMGDVELILTMLAEATSTEITKSKDSKGMNEIKQDVKKGGQIAGNTRKKIEAETGKKVITKSNRKELK